MLSLKDLFDCDSYNIIDECYMYVYVWLHSFPNNFICSLGEFRPKASVCCIIHEADITIRCLLYILMYKLYVQI